MEYKEVVEKAKQSIRKGSSKVEFVECEVWKKGDQINLWTYWQGYQLNDVYEKGVDVLLVGQDWGSPASNKDLCDRIGDIQNGVNGATYIETSSPTDKRLALMFKAFGDDIDITSNDPGMRLFFTNYSLGYRRGSETGGMTKSIMCQDAELFDDLVIAIKPKIIICLGKITYEMVSGGVARDFSKVLKKGEPFITAYPKNPAIPVYGVAHPGARGLYNIGGDETVMRMAWDKIAAAWASQIQRT